MLPVNQPAVGQIAENDAQFRAYYRDLSPELQKPLHLSLRIVPAANNDAGLALEIQVDGIVGWH